VNSSPTGKWLDRRIVLVCALLGFASLAAAHGVAQGDSEYLRRLTGVAIGPLIYLGAKHMVTGCDHLLYLAGVIFFVSRLRDVALYVTLFAVGHSATLLLGVLAGIQANSYVIDAIIGLSVVYKGLENIGAFAKLPYQIDSHAAVLVFGLAHGFGLSTKLQHLSLPREGMVANMLSFNVGVELGQLTALALILLAFRAWQASGSFERDAYAANVALITAGFVLTGYQLTGYLLG
jgi:hypothetical protein